MGLAGRAQADAEAEIHPPPRWAEVEGPEAREVLACHYGVVPRSLQRLSRSSVNALFRLTSRNGARLLKRLGRDPGPKWPDLHAHALRRVRRQGVPVVPLVESVTGATTVRHGGSLWQLSRYVPGRAFQDGDGGELRSVARCVAAIHAVPLAGLPVGVSDPTRDVETWLEHGPDALECLRDAVRGAAGVPAAEMARWDGAYSGALDRALGELDASGYACLPRVLTHGELTGSNLRFDPGTGALLAVLDWDGVAVRPRAYDLARGALFLARRHRKSFAVYGELVASFLDEVAGAAPVTPAERDALVPILELFFVPTPHYVQALRRHAPGSLPWFLNWSAEGASTVRSILEPHLRGGPGRAANREERR